MTAAPLAKDPLSGHPGHLSDEQVAKLKEFKAKLTEAGYFDPSVHNHHDNNLLRFLRARKWIVEKAVVMWIDTENWRREFGVDKIYDTFTYDEKSLVDKIYPRFYHKTDKDGRPVYIEILEKFDYSALYKVTTPERQEQSLINEYEKFLRDRLPVCSEIKGYPVETSCTIMDLKSVGVTQFWKVKDYVQKASSIAQNNYPETMGKFYVINAPWGFSTVWSLVKGWLDEATVNKINILGSDYQKELLSQIGAENLPTILGGSCICEGGCSMSDAGPWNKK